jgi:hypothetical protein
VRRAHGPARRLSLAGERRAARTVALEPAEDHRLLRCWHDGRTVYVGSDNEKVYALNAGS